jgi:hypothetical protein
MIVEIEVKHILTDEEIFECVLEFLSQTEEEIKDKLKEFSSETSKLLPHWRKSTALARLTLLVENLRRATVPKLAAQSTGALLRPVGCGPSTLDKGFPVSAHGRRTLTIIKIEYLLSAFS